MTKWHGCLIVITMIKKWLQVIWYEHRQSYPNTPPTYVSTCRNPILREVWGRHSHSRKWDLGIFRDSRKLRARLQCSLYHWKGLEVYMSKMASHEPFGHMQYKLWSKEGSGVKLAIWFPTTKSQESTRFRCVQVKCDTLLESFRGELQLWFKPRPDPSLGQGVISVQSLGSPNRDSFGTPLWESREKKPFGCKCGREL